ncbi:MAG TPA: hypothetical protein VGD52_23640 [Pseudoduganella sp.]
MSRERESLQRQVALVSYGSSFLRNKLALQDWYQHGIFFGAPQQFRDRTGNALLAGDIALWLANLAQGGATRLSLHPVEALGIEPPPALGQNRHVVAVHYPDRYQLWAAGVEQAAWKAGGQGLPNAAAYAGDVDCYVCVEERPGRLDVPHTDWKKLAAAIAADLEMPVPSGSVPVEPFIAFNRKSESWAEKPLFVATGADSLAHRVLATLDRARGKFEHDNHPKNENSDYPYLDEERAAAVDHWKARLDSWMIEVQLRAANIDNGSAVRHQDEAPFARLQPPPPPRQPAAATHEEAPNHETPAVATVPPAKGKWTDRIGMVVGIAVLSLFVLALAKVISHFPWLALVFALPWAPYMHYKD